MRLIRISPGPVHLGQVLKWLVVLIGLTYAVGYMALRVQWHWRSEGGETIRYTPYEIQAIYRQMLCDICRDEADLFDARAWACLDRAERGTSWEEAGEESDILRLCPYPWDVPNPPAWAAQVKVWHRAAEKSRAASARYAAIR